VLGYLASRSKLPLLVRLTLRALGDGVEGYCLVDILGVWYQSVNFRADWQEEMGKVLASPQPRPLLNEVRQADF